MNDPVLVVGGGIGGLVAARAIARAGLDVLVVERAPELRAQGAGIALGANAMRALRGLGIGDAIAAHGRALEAAALTDGEGRVLSAADLDDIAAKYGTSYAIHRRVLHDCLADGLTDAGRERGATVEIRCGTTPTAIEARGDGRVDVVFAEGAPVRARAVIGADGLHSTVRTLVFGANEPFYAGYTCWRWTGPVPGVAARPIEMWGRGTRVGIVPLVGDDVYTFLVATAPRGTPADPAHARVGHVRERFAGFAGDVPRLLAAMGDDDDRVMHHDIEEIEQTPWTQGAIALLGDAAHAMTPNYGQGAAMAIEDAVVLARELVAHHDVATALRTYEERRRPRVTALQRGARRLGALAHWRSPLATWARDLAMRLAPASAARKTVEDIVAFVA